MIIRTEKIYLISLLIIIIGFQGFCQESIDYKLKLDNILIHQFPANRIEDSLMREHNGKQILYLDVKKHNDITFIWNLYQNGEIVNDTNSAYAFRLAGFDKDWIYQEDDNFTRYTNLSPGSYTFEVYSMIDGERIDENLKQIVVILPKFYQTWWARLMEIGLFVAVIIVV